VWITKSYFYIVLPLVFTKNDGQKIYKIAFLNSPLEEYSDFGRREVDEFGNASTPSRKRATPEEGNNYILGISRLSEITQDVFSFPHIFVFWGSL
jgi:hypothetical protein